MLGQVLHDFNSSFFELLKEHIFQTQVVCELRPIEIFVANLALDHYVRTLSFDVLDLDDLSDDDNMFA